MQLRGWAELSDLRSELFLVSHRAKTWDYMGHAAHLHPLARMMEWVIVKSRSWAPIYQDD